MLACKRALLSSIFLPNTIIQNSVRRTHNDAIIQLLKRNQEEEQNSTNRNGYKVRAFRQAIKLIGELDQPITHSSDVAKVKGIGLGIRRRIQAFLDGTSYEETPEQKEFRASLSGLPHFGPTTVNKLVAGGCTTFRDLRRPRFQALLKPKQHFTVKYYEHLLRPVTLHEAKTVVKSLREGDLSEERIVLTGQHRRHSLTADHVEVLILSSSSIPIPIPQAPPSDPDTLNRMGRAHASFRPNNGYSKTEELALDFLTSQLVPELITKGIISDTVTSFARRWTGFVRIPQDEDGEADSPRSVRIARTSAIKSLQGRFVQMEMSLVPEKSLGAALLMTTGDQEFIRTVQRRALKMGMLLNEFGLWQWKEAASEPSPNTPSGYWKFMTASDSEEGIFAELGMEVVLPHKRNYSHLRQQDKKASRKSWPV
ncbi:hypothetical protein AAF712_003824 [Marasmius tenuissimus]|uniref:DNA-directed DNA polymerase X domain-containing protein n=1 Tax=Marasmius tenuissimus TaxID=585030 RepID=A0ABR3A818_9AGAR